MEKYVCVDYLCCLQTKLCVTSKVKVFENRTVLIVYSMSHVITPQYVHNFMFRYLKTISLLPNLTNII